MSLNIVKGKDRAVAGGKLSNRFIKGDAIHNRHRIGVFGAFYYLDGSFTVVGRLLHLDASCAKVHQDLINGQTVQPGGKGRFTTKASNFSKELNEDLLCEVFRLRDVTCHSQTERINPAVMSLVKLLKGCHIALSGFLSQRKIRFRLSLEFGCGHVFVLGQATKDFSSFSPVRHAYHESAFSKERQSVGVALNAGVMQRFERVVALPDPKDIEFPSRIRALKPFPEPSPTGTRVNDNAPLRQRARS